MFAAVGLGSVIGAQVAMTFGVLAAALAGAKFERHEVAYIVGLGSTGAVAAVLFFCIAFGKIMVTSLNSYGSFIVDSGDPWLGVFRGTQMARLSRTNRVLYIVAAVALACGLALAGKDSFLKSFEAFILLLLAVFTPWSAINLVDYYGFTRSRYDVPALSDPNGRYGRWNTAGIVVYLIGILVQIPFLATGLYTGPAVAALGGADISWILGLIVPGVIYYLVARRSDRRIPPQLILPEETAAAGPGR